MEAWAWLRLYGVVAAVFLTVDFVWIGTVANGFYAQHLGSLLRDDVGWPAALLFYAIYVAGIVVFAVLPALEVDSALRAVLLGAFLGFFAYATFDLTCLALFRSFPLVVAVVDMAWGTIVTAAVAAAGLGIGRWLGLGA